MEFENLLPVGSVVLLKNAQKKIVIIGYMPVKHIESGNDTTYDYIGVPYPEGYVGQESALLFMHEDIKDIFYIGFNNEERKVMVDTIQKIIDKADDVIKQSE